MSNLKSTIWGRKNRNDDEDDDKSEVLANLVKVAVLTWSATLLTFSYVRLPDGQKILDFDPTFIASVFSGSLAAFGLTPSKGGTNTSTGSGNGTSIKKDERGEPEIMSAIDSKGKSKK
jgi:hypothetical protein